ncbi:hypothetical protein CMMCAS03_00575 [Clavibacter michiganensis subsp. michiganensis]|nr:hypothetical protein CMMCAS03_00575 [Clavibacter michiganensis subsp. michiganensis]
MDRRRLGRRDRRAERHGLAARSRPHGRGAVRPHRRRRAPPSGPSARPRARDRRAAARHRAARLVLHGDPARRGLVRVPDRLLGRPRAAPAGADDLAPAGGRARRARGAAALVRSTRGRRRALGRARPRPRAADALGRRIPRLHGHVDGQQPLVRRRRRRRRRPGRPRRRRLPRGARGGADGLGSARLGWRRARDDPRLRPALLGPRPRAGLLQHPLAPPAGLRRARLERDAGRGGGRDRPPRLLHLGQAPPGPPDGDQPRRSRRGRRAVGDLPRPARRPPRRRRRPERRLGRREGAARDGLHARRPARARRPRGPDAARGRRRRPRARRHQLAAGLPRGAPRRPHARCDAPRRRPHARRDGVPHRDRRARLPGGGARDAQPLRDAARGCRGDTAGRRGGSGRGAPAPGDRPRARAVLRLHLAAALQVQVRPALRDALARLPHGGGPRADRSRADGRVRADPADPAAGGRAAGGAG